MTITIGQAYDQWETEIKPLINVGDLPTLSKSWSKYTDSLRKDGELSAVQYHYCPDHTGGDIPADEDAERDWMLEDCFGLVLETKSVPRRGDNFMSDLAHHWSFTIHRRDQVITGYFSQGGAYKSAPTLPEILSSIRYDAQSYDQASDFDDWASELGRVCESCGRATLDAKNVWAACERVNTELTNMFSGEELAELDRIFEDF